MNKLIYVDDSQISFSETIHINIDSPIKLPQGLRLRCGGVQ